MTTATTKPQALSILKGLPLEQLNELIRLSEMIFVPQEDQLIKVTFSQMVDKAHKLADIHFPEWTDRSKTDFGEFLIELMALFSEKDFLYSNAFGLEAFLEKAKKYSTVYSYAISRCGYTPRICVGTVKKVLITYTSSVETVYQAGELVLEHAGATYSLASMFRVSASSTARQVLVDFVIGTFTKQLFTFNGRGLRLSNKNIDFLHLSCKVGGDPFTRVNSFSYSSNTAKDFTATPEIDGSADIYFGRNGFGQTPDLGSSVEVSYFYDCSPLDADSGTLEVKADAIGGLEVSSAVISSLVTSGQVQEDISALRRNAALHYRTQGNIINKFDLIDALKQNPGVAKATALLLSNLFIYYIVPKAGNDEEDLIAVLDSTVLKYNLIGGFSVVGAVTTRITPTLKATIYTLTGYAKAELKAECMAWLESYTDPLQDAEYGKDFILTDVLVGLIASVKGVQNVVFTEVMGATPANIVVQPYEILGKINWANSTNVLTIV